MKDAFVAFIRDLQETVRAQRQERIREVELSWNTDELASFRQFVKGLHSSEKADICHALSDARAVQLLEILLDFAEGIPELRNSAFESMAKTSPQARVYLARRLVNSQNAELRAKACKMLGAVGSPARGLLEHALGDEDATVQQAAIEAISRGAFKGLEPRILPFLASSDKNTRFAALQAIASFGAVPTASSDALLSILEDDQQDEQARRLAARILGRSGDIRARGLLLAALRDQDAPEALRMAAAESLSAWCDLDAVKAVLQAVGDHDAVIAQMAHMSLNRNSSEAFASILAKLLADDDTAIAGLAAELLGALDSGIAGQTLLDRLKTERRMPVIGALASALGNAGVPQAWDALMTKIHEENIDDPAIFSALAEVAKEENLEEFAALFDAQSNAASKRIILERLANFALTSPVPPGLKSLATRLLNETDQSLHIWAATILGHVSDLRAQDAALILGRLADLGEEPHIHTIIAAMLRNKNGELGEIFLKAPEKASQLLAQAVPEAGSMGKNADALFLKAANWARQGASGAKEALKGMGLLAPAALAKAMPKCADQIFLIEAWSSLPDRERAAHRPNFHAFFAAASPEDALAGIRILSAMRDLYSLQNLADVAFTSTNPDIRKAALSQTAGLVLAPQG